MDCIIPSFVDLLAPSGPCFRREAFADFQHVLVAWLLCPGPRTSNEVRQASALAGREHRDEESDAAAVRPSPEILLHLLRRLATVR